MTTRMAQIVADVEDRVERARALATVDRPVRLKEFEDELWGLVLAVGAAMMALFLESQASRGRPVEYLHNGEAYRLAETVPITVGTRFGRVTFLRRVGRMVRIRRARDLPIDRELGLVGHFSVGVVLFLGRLCAQMAFASVQESFALVHGWTPARRSVLRMVDALGEQAPAFMEQLPAPDDDGEVLVIEVDAKGAPMINGQELARRKKGRKLRRHASQRRHRRAKKRRYERVRRTSGKKSKNAKMATVGVIYTLRHTPNGLEGPINKEVVATFENMEALFICLQQRAKIRGYGSIPTVFLADGQDHIWRLKDRYFPHARECVDWWHIVEKVWSLGATLFGARPQDVKEFVEQQIINLRKGAIHVVLSDLQGRLERTAPTGPGNRQRRDALRDLHDHLVKNVLRLNYAEFRREDLPIGTGVCEGAVRHLVAVRFDGPGMRWSLDRAERLLQLRCIVVNRNWDAFAAHVSQPGALTLLPAPLPTIPHEAKAKEAA